MTINWPMLPGTVFPAGPPGTAGQQGPMGLGGVLGPLGRAGPTGPPPWSVPPTNWAAFTAYTATPPASSVLYSNTFYVCIINHVSGSTFDGTKWSAIVSNVGPPGPTGPGPWSAPTAWAASTSYSNVPPASAVSYLGTLYACTVAHVSTSTFDSTKWAATTIGATGATGAAGAAGANGAAGPSPWSSPVPWAASTAYVATAPASCVTYGTNTYICTTAHTSTGVFAAGNWALLLPSTSTPMTTEGDLRYFHSGNDARLAVGSSGQALISSGTDPAWTSFLQSGAGATSRSWNSKIADVVSVLDFGADPTGSADCATAIQNAVNALPVSGGEVIFPPGLYKLGSTVNIGNGSTGVPSTRYGVHLKGVGLPMHPPFQPVSITTANVRILWSGGASTMFQFNGPLGGWGMSNMLLDANSVASIGLLAYSCSFGHCQNLRVINAVGDCVQLNTNDDTANSAFNTFTNLGLSVPNASFAVGLYLTGKASGLSDTALNVFQNTTINIQGTPTMTNTVYGIILETCDTNQFYMTEITGPGPNVYGVLFKYTLSSYPNSNGFVGTDMYFSAGNTKYWTNQGTPGVNIPNWVFGFGRGNGLQPPFLANTAYMDVFANRQQARSVASLDPVTNNGGARAFVNDSTVIPGSTNFGAVVVGGGTHGAPVWCDGGNWLIG
jgi:hypothetical protein